MKFIDSPYNECIYCRKYNPCSSVITWNANHYDIVIFKLLVYVLFSVYLIIILGLLINAGRMNCIRVAIKGIVYTFRWLPISMFHKTQENISREIKENKSFIRYRSREICLQYFITKRRFILTFSRKINNCNKKNTEKY